MPSVACVVTAAASHAAPRTTSRRAAARGVDEMPQRQRQQRVRGHAVLELHGEQVLEQIAPPRLVEQQPVGDGMNVPSINGQVL